MSISPFSKGWTVNMNCMFCLLLLNFICIYLFKISCRGLVSAALTRNGELYTFGCGQDDRLGHGHSFEEPNQTIPRLVDSLQVEKKRGK